MCSRPRESWGGAGRGCGSRVAVLCRVVGVCTVSRVRARSAALTDFNSRSLKDRTLSERRSRRARTPALYAQLWSIMHSSWIFPRDNEWIFRGYRALMDLGSNSGLCLRAEAPPDLGRLLESGPALRTVWTVAVWTPDPGETHQAKLGEAGTGFSHPKIQNPESGIRDGTV